MSEEIKEILDCFKRHIEQNESICCLSMNEVPILLDYITNLQKENKHLSKSYAEAILFNQKRCEQNKRLREENEKLTRFKYNIPNDKTKSVPTITKSYKKEYENYKSRCEKAIEFIKENTKVIPFNEIGEGGGLELNDYDIPELLELLGGDDNE